MKVNSTSTQIVATGKNIISTQMTKFSEQTSSWRSKEWQNPLGREEMETLTHLNKEQRKAQN